MQVISLQSGSNGNCIYVEARGTRLLFDAGIPGQHAKERLAGSGRDITKVDGVVISHDHSDHIKCAGVFNRKFGLPIYATAATLDAGTRHRLGEIDDVRHFEAGSELKIGHVAVETISTPHDGVDGVGFVVDDGQHRLGILTDLGHVFDGLDTVIGSLDAVLLESNYDPAMLDEGGYPAFLKRRIQGSGGHISNVEAAELLNRAGSGRLKWACLGHMSEDNNDPELAMQTHREVLGNGFRLEVATRYEATGILEV